MTSKARRGYGRSRIAASLAGMMRGQSSGTISPPSAPRPSRRMSVKDCCAAWPRVLTYFMRFSLSLGRGPGRGSQQFFQPDPYHRRRDRAQRLDALDRGVDVLLRRHVGEDHDVDLLLALPRFLLEDGVDRDREVGADPRHVGEHAG